MVKVHIKTMVPRPSEKEIGNYINGLGLNLTGIIAINAVSFHGALILEFVGRYEEAEYEEAFQEIKRIWRVIDEDRKGNLYYLMVISQGLNN